LSHGFRDGSAECGAAVQHGDADPGFGDLTAEVPRCETLAQELDAAHPGLRTVSAVMPFGADLEPVAGWPLTIVARWCARSA
jgi:hypothetical protein